MSFILGGTLVVGVEDIDSDSVRVYIDARYLNRYFIVAGEDAQRVRREWGRSFMGHLFTSRPPSDAIFDGNEENEPTADSGAHRGTPQTAQAENAKVGGTPQ